MSQDPEPLGVRVTQVAKFNHGWTQGNAGDGPVVINLSLSSWVFGDGLGLDEAGDWRLTPPTGHESMFAQHVLAELRKNLDRLSEDAAYAESLQKLARDHGELLCMVPRDGRLRQQTFAMLEETLDNKFETSLRRFTAMKLYRNPEPTQSHFWLRKFKGTRKTQIVINLSETPYRFFRFHGRHRDDVDIDPMPLKRWSDNPDELANDLAAELRMTSEDYLRRIRETAENGTIYFLLPVGPERRRRTMETFLEILNMLPQSIGGPIALHGADIRRIYPNPTTLSSE